MTKKIYIALSFLVVTFLFFTATAFAAGAVEAAVPPDADLSSLGRPLYDAIVHGQYWMAAALALVFAVALFKRYAPAGRGRAFANSDAGGGLLVLLGSFGGAAATLLLGGPMTWDLVIAAAKVATSAAGGFVLIKNILIAPLMKSDWYKNRAPLWLKALISMSTWVFAKQNSVAAAEDAGVKALEDKPAPGNDGVVGKPDEF